MNDEQILERGGTEEDIIEYSKQNGANLTKEDFMPNTTNEWEENFTDKFCVMLERSQYTEEQIEEVYSFINQLISSERAKLIKEIEDKLITADIVCDCDKCISEFQSLLNSLK